MKPLLRFLRFDALQRMGCICCAMNLDLGLEKSGMTVEIHHQNAGGHAGQKRLGDEFTVPLCSWHHRAVLKPGLWSADMARLYGPSWAGGSKPFRAIYGTDADQLAAVDGALRARGLPQVCNKEAA